MRERLFGGMGLEDAGVRAGGRRACWAAEMQDCQQHQDGWDHCPTLGVAAGADAGCVAGIGAAICCTVLET